MTAYADYKPLTFHDATRRFTDGNDSPRAYLERCLETIAQREPVVKAFAAINEAGARASAEASSARWKAGKPMSSIDGMPIAIKDLLETRDMPTEMGCAAMKGNFPKRDNAAVWALRQAGAVILAKTVTAELGGSHPGPTTNPFDPRRSFLPFCARTSPGTRARPRTKVSAFIKIPPSDIRVDAGSMSFVRNPPVLILCKKIKGGNPRLFPAASYPWDISDPNGNSGTGVRF